MNLPYVNQDGVRWAIGQFPRLATHAQRTALTVLGSHFDENGYCYPSMERLAEAAATSRGFIKRLIAQLARLGIIEIRPGGHGPRNTHRYHAAGWGMPAQGASTSDLEESLARARQGGLPGLERDSSSPIRDSSRAKKRAQTSPEDSKEDSNEESKGRSRAHTREHARESGDIGDPLARQPDASASDGPVKPPASPPTPAGPLPSSVRTGQPDQVAPKADQVAPKADRVAPKADQVDAKADQVAPEGALDPEEMRRVWNQVVAGSRIPRAYQLTAVRKRRLAQIGTELCEDRIGIWRTICLNVAGDSWCRGEHPSPGHEAWVATLDWLLQGDRALGRLERAASMAVQDALPLASPPFAGETETVASRRAPPVAEPITTSTRSDMFDEDEWVAASRVAEASGMPDWSLHSGNPEQDNRNRAALVRLLREAAAPGPSARP